MSAKSFLRVLEGSLTASAEWAADFDDDDDENEDQIVEHEEVVGDDDDDDDDDEGDEPIQTMDEFEAEQQRKRDQLFAKGLGPKAAPALPDDERRMHAVLPTASSSAAKAHKASDFVLQAPIVADDSVRWQPVQLSSSFKDLRYGTAACPVGAAGALFGGVRSSGSVLGDGALFVDDPESGSVRVVPLASKNGSVTKAQKKARDSAAPGALAGASISYCPGSDTLVVIGGVRGLVRQNRVFVLRNPRAPDSTWGVLHPANPRLDERFGLDHDNYTGIQHKHRNAAALSFCRCDHAVQNRYSMRDFGPEQERMWEPHWATPTTPRDLPALSYHSSVGLASTVVTFGGKTAKGDLFGDVLVVQSVPLVQYNKTRVSSWYTHQYRFRMGESVFSFAVHKVDAAAGYVPTTGAACVALGAVAYVIGGFDSNQEPTSNIFQFDTRTNELTPFKVSCGRLPALAMHSAALVKETVVVFGGSSAKRALLNNVFIVNLVTRAVAGLVVTSGVPPSPRARHSSIMVGDNLLVVGGTLTEGASDAAVQLRGIAHMRSIDAAVHNFAALRENAQFADVVIHNGDVQVHAHRVVLAARCGVLRALLQGGAHSTTLASGRKVSCVARGHKFTLTIDDAPTEFGALLDFFYTDTVDLEHCNVEVLTRMAADFELVGLQRMVESVADSTVIVPSSTFLADFRGMLGDRSCSDVSFAVEDNIVYAHRAIVAQCEYFRTMMSGGFREASAAVIPIQDVEHDVFLAGLLYLYTGVVDSRDAQTLFELLYISQFWQLPELKATCETFLLQRFVTADTCLLLLDAANDNECSAEFTKAVTAAVRQFYGASIAGGGGGGGDGDDDDNVEELLAALRSRLDVDKVENANENGVRDGWVPVGGIARCATCQRPYVYDTATWSLSQEPPVQQLEKLSLKNGFVATFVAVHDPDAVGFRFDVELPHLPAHASRVVVRSTFRTIKLARQNAALFALHHLHSV